METSQEITIKPQGVRLYVIGNTYPIKDALKEAGAHWDKDAGQWWIGAAKRAAIEAAITKASQMPKAETYTPQAGETMVAVSGNTYPVKDQLRALGGSWDGASKVWRVPASQSAKAAALVAAAPKEPYRRNNRGFGASTYRAYGSSEANRKCRCAKPLDEGDGECMKCGYYIY